jgi:hypothetical protein
MGMIPFYKPKPAPPAAFKGQPFPWPQANPFAKLYVTFATKIFKIAHGRTIEADGECSVRPVAGGND